MATKFVYSDTEITEIVAKYTSGVSLDVLAETYSKSVASVRMKLVKLGVYQKAVKPASTRTTSADVPKSEFPTTKSGILAYYKAVLNSVGPAIL